VIMVTHDPAAASYAGRVLFLADGQVAGELLDPTPDTVLDHLRRTSDQLRPDSPATASSSSSPADRTSGGAHRARAWTGE
jgi:putative ABC transport system ATP-binding protein